MAGAGARRGTPDRGKGKARRSRAGLRVSEAGFEPATPASRGRCSTGLSYTLIAHGPDCLPTVTGIGVDRRLVE